ncbi:MAG: tryptophan-rich sensory protein [Candidatus Pacebacteria bacterium]|nr:tryptophan-rich sensory protein [Candidatus Paceibacterota bacterium]
MKTSEQYRSYRKPSWAPPARLFGPVWILLYAIIAVSFGYVGYLWFHAVVPTLVALPFALNLIFNLLFTTFQFKWRNFILAALDMVLVWLTLAWALWVILPFAPWVAYSNLPYLAWVTFATVLQLTVTAMNRTC